MKNKLSIGFFAMFAAIIVGIVSIVLYGNAYITSQPAYKFMIAAAVVAAISLLGAQKLPKIFNWGAPIAALLFAAGIGYSATVMADPIGYVISGLYNFDTLRGYISFCVAAVIAWVLYLAAGFMGMAKEN